MTNHINPRDWEALSAYLDGQLAPKERQRLEARLQSRADLRAALEELRQTRGVLRARLPVRAPRNFTLTPEMAGIRGRARQGMSIFPAMRLASALSTFLFFVVVIGDLFLSGILGASRVMVAQQREAAGVVTEAPAIEAPAAAAPEVAIEAAGPTAQAMAKAVEPASPTALPALAQPIPMITESAQAQGRGEGAGGAGGGEAEQADQAALSQMAPAATATPLPTPTLAPSATPVPPADQIANQAAKEELKERLLPEPALWRLLELTLLIIGVSTGLIALYLHRMGRA